MSAGILVTTDGSVAAASVGTPLSSASSTVAGVGRPDSPPVGTSCSTVVRTSRLPSNRVKYSSTNRVWPSSPTSRVVVVVVRDLFAR